jgi:glucose uptake protein
MNWFIALIPALGWGIMPIIAQMTKGNPREQLTGTTITALFFQYYISSEGDKAQDQ